MKRFVCALLLGLLPLSGFADTLPDLSGRAPKQPDHDAANPYNPSDPHAPRADQPNTVEWPFTVGDWSFRIVADDTLQWSRAEQVAAGLRDAATTYTNMGFVAPEVELLVLLKDDPEHVTLGMDRKALTAHYSALADAIILPIKPANTAIDVKVTAAHELFHALQNTQMSVFEMGARKWFIEASAEYAANFKVYPDADELSDLTEHWFNASLTTTSDTLNYESSHFLNYLMALTQTSLHELFQELLDADGVFAHQTIDTVVQNTIPGTDLISFMREFTVHALFDPNAPERVSLNSGSNFLRTRINQTQLVSTFRPYEAQKTRIDTLSVAAEYGVHVWALDMGIKGAEQDYEILLSSETVLPGDAEIALFVTPAGERRANLAPVQVVRGVGVLKPVRLPKGQDLFAIVVNGGLEPINLRLSARVLRSDAVKTTQISGVGWRIDKPSRMVEEPPEHGAVWQARASDIKPFETLSLFRRGAGNDETPQVICNDYANTLLSDETPGAALGAGRAVTIGGQTGWMLVHQAQWERQHSKDTYYYHDTQRIRSQAGSYTPKVDVAVTLLCFNRDDEAVVVRAVAGTDDPHDMTWAETALMSFRMPEPTEIAMKDTPQDEDPHGAHSGVLYERVFEGCTEGGFDMSTSGTFFDTFHLGPVGHTSEDTYRVDEIIMLARWDRLGEGVQSFPATIHRDLGGQKDGLRDVVVRKGKCLPQQPEVCDAIVKGPLTLKDGMHQIWGPRRVIARLSCLGNFRNGSPIKVLGAKSGDQSSDQSFEKFISVTGALSHVIGARSPIATHAEGPFNGEFTGEIKVVERHIGIASDGGKVAADVGAAATQIGSIILHEPRRNCTPNNGTPCRSAGTAELKFNLLRSDQTLQVTLPYDWIEYQPNYSQFDLNPTRLPGMSMGSLFLRKSNSGEYLGVKILLDWSKF